ncbi:uncharacterized protein ARMOST_22098 [Armillaria ostoyae]|uniref:Uncharacterized protein n=1 Tax=Armillaria ostoyae TaxID=47428 RepID=A0A284SBW1_ARMOS|nr:uncharacterized protein ARMOST_22098 [Armillaria ostoyae]
MSVAQDPVPDVHDDHDFSSTANGVDEKLAAPSPPSSVVIPTSIFKKEKDARHNSQALKEDLDEDKMEDVSVVPLSLQQINGNKGPSKSQMIGGPGGRLILPPNIYSSGAASKSHALQPTGLGNMSAEFHKRERSLLETLLV